jgi:predicted transcriptional regulator
MYDDNNTLKNKSRKLIYDYILSHNGTSFGSIKDFFGMKNSTLEYHLHHLEKHQKIYSKREGRRRCYYCKHKLEHQTTTFSKEFTDLTNLQRRILNQIKNKPGITNKELIQKNKINRKKLSYNLKRLGELNLIWMAKNNGNTIGYEYISKEKLRNEIYKQLISKLLSKELDEETYFKIKKKLDLLDIDDIQI